MRILVLFAHPVETSFAAAVHAKLVEALRGRGHEVDDCDLNVEGFDPVMTRQERIDYHDVAVNRARVAPYVDRLLAAEALVFSFPVWNMGFPAILKGFVDKVFLPGVSFTLNENGDYIPALHNIKRLGVVCTYGGGAPADVHDGRPAAPLPDPLAAPDLRARRAVRLSRPLRHGSHQARAARGVPRKGRGEVLDLVSPGLQPRPHSVPEGSSPSMARRCFVSSVAANSMNARTRAARRRSAWVSVQSPASSSGGG